MLQRLPGHLQQQTLLRVHGERLPGRNAEERGVEPADVVEESAAPYRHPGRRVRIGVKKAVDIPAIARDLPDRVAPLAQEVPERLRTVAAARKPAADADHGDWFGPCFGCRLQLPLLIKREQHQLLLRKSCPAVRAIAHQSCPG